MTNHEKPLGAQSATADVTAEQGSHVAIEAGEAAIAKAEGR